VADDQWAIDSEGRPLPHSPDQVREICARALAEGTLLAAILEMPSGDIAVQVLGLPSEKIATALMDVAVAYARSLKGH